MLLTVFRRFDLVVRLDETHRQDLDNLRNLYVSLPGGSQIPLREVAGISYQPGPMQISRENTNRSTYVGINIRNRDVQSVVSDIQEILDQQLDLPPGYYLRYGGAFENFERAQARLEVVVPIALVLIYILIYFALKSFKQTAMIYVAIPLAAIGGVFALWLRDMPFSISAGVGFIVLFGVAVLNGLVLISGLNELKEEGVANLSDRIRQGTRRRIRPIMLTALTDVLGFFPMAVSASAGAEVQKPLATVVIGGMITSTLLTLFIIPLLYRWMENRKKGGSSTPKMAFASIAFGLLLLAPATAAAQETRDSLPEINRERAVELALQNFPLLKNRQLEIEQQEALKGTAFDFGNTGVFTGGEEIDDDRGIYTRIGIEQRGIDIFGIAPKLKLQKERVALAEQAYRLSSLELEREVKSAWTNAFVAQRKLLALERLDSVYGQFEQAVSLHYEVEAISELQLLTSQNKVNQISLQREQAYSDFLTALQKLNLWLGEEQLYSVPEEFSEESVVGEFLPERNKEHPFLEVARQQMEVAEAERRAARAAFLPKFNAEYGKQEVNGQSRFFSFQLGISVPLFSGAAHGQAKAAKIEQQIARQNTEYRQRELENRYTRAVQNYQKWRASWQYYEEQALPLVERQREGSLLAFREGAIEYVAFIQNLDEVVRVELGAVEALEEYLKAVAELEFFLNN